MISLSNRQYPMLQTFAEAGDGFYMSITEAQGYDQRPFRSMLYRKWITFKPGRGFRLTKDGQLAWYRFFHTKIFRKDPSLPLTSYFDPEMYKLRVTSIGHRKSHRKGAVA